MAGGRVKNGFADSYSIAITRMVYIVYFSGQILVMTRNIIVKMNITVNSYTYILAYYSYNVNCVLMIFISLL